MVALHPQLLLRPLGVATRRPAPGAFAHGLVALAFFYLTARHLISPLAASPARALVDAWWLLELTAIWCVPLVWFLSRGRGMGPLSVGRMLPLVAGTTLAIGAYRESTTLLCWGVGCFLLLAKCASLLDARSSRRSREILAVRVLVGALAGLLSAAVAALALLCIREVFAPAALHGAAVARAVLLLSGTFYFATLAVLEVLMAPRAEADGASRLVSSSTGG